MLSALSNIISTAVRAPVADEGRAQSASLFGVNLPGLLGNKSASGPKVTADSALQVSAVYGCVRILADAVSTLPRDTVKLPRGAQAPEPYRPRPTWLDHPNDEDDWIDFVCQIVVSLLLDGNAYIAVSRSDTGSIFELLVLDPSLVDIERVPVGSRRKVLFQVNGDPFTSTDILHIRGLIKPGEMKGLSPIAAARETIGLALAAQEYGGSFFSNGAVPGGIVEAENKVSDTGIRQLKRAWNEAHKGAGNASRLAVLTEGAKFTKISLSPDEAQFLETRKFQVPDIARIFGVPPHLLADASGSTSWGSGLAEQGQAFATLSLRPIVERLESRFSRLLYSEGRSKTTSVSLDMDGLTRGAPEARIKSYSLGLQSGIYTLDEVRGWEGLPEVPDGLGKVHRVQVNTAPLDLIDEEPEETPPPSAGPVAGPDSEEEPSE